MLKCPQCESTDVSIDSIEEDCWSYNPRSEGHYTRKVGEAAVCGQCNHEWEVEQEDDGPDPDDRYEYGVDADHRAEAYFSEEQHRREPK